MGYTNYNREMYRTGFRPYGQTNPWSATQLNGMSIEEATLGQVHPFGPWELHGILGQVHPFTETGGWPLHGYVADPGLDVTNPAPTVAAPVSPASTWLQQNAGWLALAALGLLILGGKT